MLLAELIHRLNKVVVLIGVNESKQLILIEGALIAFFYKVRVDNAPLPAASEILAVPLLLLSHSNKRSNLNF